VDAGTWSAVDEFVQGTIVPDDEALAAALAASEEAGLPPIQVSPPQGKLLNLLARSIGSASILEFGTLGGYSTIWLGQALAAGGRLITLEADARYAKGRGEADVDAWEGCYDAALKLMRRKELFDESTVSRVVTNKYIHTPQGVFEMKYFFHSGIASTYGESVSSVTIKQRIRKIVEEENPKRPLSDSKIVKILEGEGLMLARRTIAKYREELRIPPSNQRKNLYTSPFAN